jgi:hypothetical protein
MTGDSPQVTQSDIDRINQISIDKYGYTAGGTPASLPVDDEKILVKLDWNINDDHRASLVYNYNDGFKLSQSDDWAMTLDNHFYESGAEMNSFVVALNSDWTDNFSTEVRVDRTELDNRQQSLDAASGFGEVQIRHNGTTIFLGPDDSRQSNEMNWDKTNFKLSGSYYLDEHTITAGYEYETLTAFNLFMQHTIGEYRLALSMSMKMVLPIVFIIIIPQVPIYQVMLVKSLPMVRTLFIFKTNTPLLILMQR